MNVHAADRRDWFRKVGRWSLAAMITGIASHLGTRWVRAGCPRGAAHCRDCLLLDRCILPHAKSTRLSQSITPPAFPSQPSSP